MRRTWEQLGGESGERGVAKVRDRTESINPVDQGVVEKKVEEAQRCGTLQVQHFNRFVLGL